MIRYKSSRQISLEGFHLPFGGKLRPENRWVKWSEAIPWDDLAIDYCKSMDATRGRPGKEARLVIGAVIIKHKLNLSDEETVLQIQENPYLQYFVGLSSYIDDPPLTPSLFVTIQKRMGDEVFSSFEQTILDSIEKKKDRTCADQNKKNKTDVKNQGYRATNQHDGAGAVNKRLESFNLIQYSFISIVSFLWNGSFS